MSLTLGELQSKFNGHTPSNPVKQDDTAEVRQLKSDLMRSEMKLKVAEEQVDKLLPLAIEMAMWKMVAASEQALATQWDEMRVMVKLTHSDFFEMIDRMVIQRRFDLLEKFVFNDEDEDDDTNRLI